MRDRKPWKIKNLNAFMPAAMMRFYERMMNECTYPDVQAFIREILEERSSAILRIVQKLNELKVRGQTIEDVRSSFNPVA